MKTSLLFTAKKNMSNLFKSNSKKFVPQYSRYNFSTLSQKRPEIKKDKTIGEYTVFDHEYDAIVLGAGGAGLRVNKIFNLINLGCIRLCRSRIKNCLYY